MTNEYDERFTNKQKLRNQRFDIRNKIVDLIGEEKWKSIIGLKANIVALTQLKGNVLKMDESRLISVMVIKTLYPTVTDRELALLANKKPSIIMEVIGSLIKENEAELDKLFTEYPTLKGLITSHDNILRTETTLKFDMNSHSGIRSKPPENFYVKDKHKSFGEK